MSTEHRLVFVEDSFAWFCTDPESAWGDDWDDAPHDCNAGWPYTDSTGGDWVKVAFDGDLVVVGGSRWPVSGRWSDSLSVKQINDGDAPWLAEVLWGRRDSAGLIEIGVQVPALCTVSEFTALVERAGGSVYRAGGDRS